MDTGVRRTAVHARSPLTRRGLLEVMRTAGWDVHEPIQLLAWVKESSFCRVIVCIEDELDWRLLADVIAFRPEALVVAIVRSDEADDVVRALAIGAHAVLPLGTPPDRIPAALDAAATGLTTLPTDVGQGLVRGVSPLPTWDATLATSDELDWLNALGQGATVLDVARASGFSEREMFRRLHRLYLRLGVRNRIEALLLLSRLGVLTADSALPD